MSELDKAAEGAGKQLATQVNKQVLNAMTNLDVVDLSAPGVTNKEIKDMDKSFRQLNTIMNSTSGETRAMMEQVRSLGSKKALGNVVKDLSEMAKFELDPDAKEGLKAMGALVTAQLAGPIEEAFKSGTFSKLKDEIDNLSQGTQEQKDKVLELILSSGRLGY